MTDAQDICETANFNPADFSIGSDKHEALCAVAHGQSWHVFDSERGQRRNERIFESEDEAAVYFLKQLFQTWALSSGTHR